MTQSTSTKNLAQITNERWQYIRDIWRNSTIGYSLLLILVGVLIGRFVLFPVDEGYNTNLYTEALSVITTILVLDRLNERRTKEEIKTRLLALAKSTNNAIAIAAIDELKARALLSNEESLLHGTDLSGANLQQADLKGLDLSGALLRGINLVESDLSRAVLESVQLGGANPSRSNLRQAELNRANLRGANLRNAILEQASLSSVDLNYASLSSVRAREADFSKAIMMWCELSNANLNQANLSEARLHNTNMTGASMNNANMSFADLSNADFTDAKLLGANLRGANLHNAEVNSVKWQSETGNLFTAVLPNGRKWSRDLDMECFTDQSHPEYERTLEQVNEIRLQNGIRLLPRTGKDRKPYYPLPGSTLDKTTMLQRVNARRAKLGLEPL